MTPQAQAEKIVQDAIDYMMGSGNPAHVVDADWFRLKWTEAVKELIEEREKLEKAEERLRKIAEIIEQVDNRCMAADGPVTRTLEEMRDDEMIEIWELAYPPYKKGR